jgi:hypothetical protein
MKTKLYTILIAALGIVPAAFGNPGANFMLRMATPNPISVTIDNQAFGSSVNVFNAYNLMPGAHRIQIYTAPSFNQNYYGQGFRQDGDDDERRRPRNGHGNGHGHGHNNQGWAMPVLLFDGWVNFPAASMVDAYLNPYNQFTIMGIQPLVISGPLYGNMPPMIIGMPEADFLNLKNSVSNKSFDSDRLALAKQAVNFNRLSSQQMFELVKLLTYESSKVELAKYGFGRVADRNNYHVVSNAFDYSSSITELTTYINSFPS